MSIEVDTLHHQVIINGKPSGKLGSGPGEFHYPSNAVVLDHHVYVCDSWNHRVQVFALPDYRFAFEFGDFFCPKWIEAIEYHGVPLLLVVDRNNARLCFHEPNGRRLSLFTFESQTFPLKAQSLDDETIEVLFEDEHTEIYELGNIIRLSDWTSRLNKPISIVRDKRGFIYVSDFGRR